MPMAKSTVGDEREYSPSAPMAGLTCGSLVAPWSMMLCASYSAQKSVSGRSMPMAPMSAPPIRPLTMCRLPRPRGTMTLSRVRLVKRIHPQPAKPGACEGASGRGSEWTRVRVDTGASGRGCEWTRVRVGERASHAALHAAHALERATDPYRVRRQSARRPPPRRMPTGGDVPPRQTSRWALAADWR